MIRVLYVDDEPDLLDIGKLFLEGTGDFLIDRKTSAEEGLDSLKNGVYDAVVSDFQMPGMDGIAFLKAVRSGFGTIPFILFTGRGREEVVIEAINNGTDFYLQKGGDPGAQFAELAHKIRQAVARRNAERSRIESEKRLADIINFLPDATFAIDKAGTVIAWNRAIEEMTGIPASTMVGKGNYEYAIPFYGKRRPILINLVCSPPDEIRASYSHIVQDGTMLAAETTLPRVRGELRTLWGKAIPLYDQTGQVAGAVESIRDITERKKAEQVLAEQYRLLAESESRLKQAEVVANIGHWELYLDTGTMIASGNAGVIYGLDSNHGIPITVVQKIPLPEYRQAMDDALAGLIKRGEPYSLDFKIRRPADGEQRDIHSTATYDPEKRVVFGIIHDITKRKKIETELAAMNEQLTAAEEELRGQYDSLRKNQKELAVSEEKYRTVIETTGTGFVMIDGEGKVLDANLTYVHFTGHTALAEISGRSVTEWTAASDKEKNAAAVRQCVQTGSVRGLEIDYAGPGGRTVPVDINASLICANGPVRILALCRDITERKRAEEALRESEKRYRDMFEINPVVMFIVDPETGKIVDANAAACRYYGYSREEFAALDIGKINIKDPAVTMKDMAHARENLGGVFQFRHRKKSGEIRDVEVFSAPVIQEGRHYLHSIVQDVTDRRRTEEALRESEEKFRDIFNNTNDAIQIHEILPDGTPGRFTDVNDASCRLLGFTREEMLLMSPQDIATGYHNPPRKKVCEEQQTRGQSRFEVEITAKNGTVIPVEINTRVVTIQKRKVLLAVLRDITEHRLAGEAIRLANKKLNLLSGITRHDIGNQLTALLQYIDLAKVSVQDAEMKKTIEKEEFLARNIQRQIEFTREYNELGTGAPSWQNVKKCVDLGVQGLDLSGVDMKVTGLDAVEIIADPLLRKVFFNLADNALRYGGEAMLSIRISSHESRNGLVLVFDDDGDGVPVHQKELIFERGYGKNTGFGLSLIQEILAITGITIRETGEPGKGARFEMTVPEGGYRFTHPRRQ